MKKLFNYCLLTLGALTLLACAGSSNQLPPEQSSGESKGQKFSACLDKHSPEECDRMINGSSQRRDRSY